jgi:hypothetical protein
MILLSACLVLNVSGIVMFDMLLSAVFGKVYDSYSSVMNSGG